VQVIVNGLLANYSKSGTGKVVVMLHGWGDNSGTFKKLVSQLSTNYHVLALDLPGFGGSQMPSTAWRLSDYSDFVAAWLKKVGIKEVYGLVGHSNGGAIAIDAVSRKVLVPKKLVLLSSSGIRRPRTLVKSVAAAGKLITKPLPRSAQTRLKKRFYKSLDSEALLLPQMEETFRKIIAQDVTDQARSIKADTLIIYGKDDKITPPDYGRQFHQTIKNSQLVLLSNAGHFVQNDRAEEVYQQITKFLKS